MISISVIVFFINLYSMKIKEQTREAGQAVLEYGGRALTWLNLIRRLLKDQKTAVKTTPKRTVPTRLW